jgi:hypothetical protein
MGMIKIQLRGYEEDLCMKDMAVERYRTDVSQLSKQIEELHEEIFEKNKIISNTKQ